MCSCCSCCQSCLLYCCGSLALLVVLLQICERSLSSCDDGGVTVFLAFTIRSGVLLMVHSSFVVCTLGIGLSMVAFLING